MKNTKKSQTKLKCPSCENVYARKDWGGDYLDCELCGPQDALECPYCGHVFSECTTDYPEEVE